MKYTTITHNELLALSKLSTNSSLILDNSDNRNYYGLLQPFSTMSDFQANGQPDIVRDYNTVNNILKYHIPSLVSFSNFTNDGRIRFQYKYDNSFTGVGYMSFQELFKSEDIKHYISDLISVDLVTVFNKNDIITKNSEDDKIKFYKGFTSEDSISFSLLQDGFTQFRNDINSNEYHKVINEHNVTVSYTEGDVYLNIFLDSDYFERICDV